MVFVWISRAVAAGRSSARRWYGGAATADGRRDAAARTRGPLRRAAGGRRRSSPRDTRVLGKSRRGLAVRARASRGRDRRRALAVGVWHTAAPPPRWRAR